MLALGFIRPSNSQMASTLVCVLKGKDGKDGVRLEVYYRYVSKYTVGDADLMPHLQSGFRPHHSTETATLRILLNLLVAIDGGDVAALVLLDLSAAFDTVDHSTLCRRLQSSFGLSGSAL